MKKSLLTAALTLAIAVSCMAQMPRYTLDTAATIKVWEAWETPTAYLTVRGALPTDSLTLTIITDAGEPYASITRHHLFDGRMAIPLAPLEPGFYRLGAQVGDSAIAALNIGYNPRGIVSPYDGQDDFAQFWQDGLKELASVKPEFKIVRELKDKSTEARRVYLVEMNSVPDEPGGHPAKVRGYWAEPRKPGRYPTIIHYPGTDGGGGTPWCMGGDDNPEMCELIVSVRGQMINNRPPYVPKGELTAEQRPYGGDFYSYGFGDKRRHYYYGAYLDVVRAIDFAASRAKCDTANIFATGYSQGGAHTLVAAALGGGRIKSAAPSITGHSDFPDDIRMAAWPENKFAIKRLETAMSIPEMLQWLSYFDVKNFAPLITCPVITNLSLQDTTDPPHVGMAAYNLMATPRDKRPLIINPLLGHQPARDWSEVFMRFFKDNTSR